MNRPLHYIPVSFLCLCLPLVAVTWGLSQCKPGDPVGRFEGSAKSSQAGKLDISLNLLCVDGHYAGTLDTPVGIYTVNGGTSKADGLRLQFARDGVTGVAVEAKTIGNGLQGTFTSGDDRGPLELHRSFAQI
jgi:hypothetical protein